jgi:methyl-accepting chemotaxis protein
VVADEVRKLAEKSARSANEIETVTLALGQKSGSLLSTVHRSVDALRQSRSVLSEVTSTIDRSAKTVEAAHQGVDAITESVNEQRSYSTHIARHVEDIARLAGSSANLMQDASRSAQRFAELASTLSQQVKRFRVE